VRPGGGHAAVRVRRLSGWPAGYGAESLPDFSRISGNEGTIITFLAWREARHAGV